MTLQGVAPQGVGASFQWHGITNGSCRVLRLDVARRDVERVSLFAVLDVDDSDTHRNACDAARREPIRATFAEPNT